jgi:hypothetical protein
VRRLSHERGRRSNRLFGALDDALLEALRALLLRDRDRAPETLLDAFGALASKRTDDAFEISPEGVDRVS